MNGSLAPALVGPDHGLRAGALDHGDACFLDPTQGAQGLAERPVDEGAGKGVHQGPEEFSRLVMPAERDHRLGVPELRLLGAAEIPGA